MFTRIYAVVGRTCAVARSRGYYSGYFMDSLGSYWGFNGTYSGSVHGIRYYREAEHLADPKGTIPLLVLGFSRAEVYCAS